MSANPAGMSEDKNRYGRQIEEAFEAAAKLAGSNLPPDRVLRTVPEPHPVGHRRPGRGRLAAHAAGVPPGRLPDEPRQGRPRRQARRPAVPQRGAAAGLPGRAAAAGPAGTERPPRPRRRRTRPGPARQPHRPLRAVRADRHAGQAGARRPRGLPGTDPRPAALPDLPELRLPDGRVRQPVPPVHQRPRSGRGSSGPSRRSSRSPGSSTAR